MSRQEKGTRMRGLPVKVQLGNFDNASGSYPTKSRLASDGSSRYGRGTISYNDLETIVFGGAVGNYYPAIGLMSGSKYLAKEQASDMPVSSTIVIQGTTKKSVIDESYIIASNVTPTNLRPYVENNLYEADGKTSSNAFFATGSSVEHVGEGFDSPLWSKHKIEIDISVTNSSTLNLVNSNTPGFGPINGVSYPMAYYNFDTKTWDPIGLGYELNSWTSPFPNAIRHAADSLMIGFTNGLFPDGVKFTNLQVVGFSTSFFGFPYHPKFHATSSQTLKMSNYINRPFLLEKAVISISGTWEIKDIIFANYNQPNMQTVSSSVNTCFLLNQRKNQNFDFEKTLGSGASNFNNTPRFRITASVPIDRSLTFGGPTVRVDTIRDLLGFSQIYSFASGSLKKKVINTSTAETGSAVDFMPITSNDVILENTNTNLAAGMNWTKKLTISMSLCTPPAQTYVLEQPLPGDYTLTGGYDGFTVVQDGTVYLGHEGTRTGLGFFNPSTRGLTGDFYATPIGRTFSVPTFNNGLRPALVPSTSKHKINPYVLLPSDELILGWQLPVSTNPVDNVITGGTESRFTFLPGTFKMVLYGSFIRNGQEENDTLNQMLTSKALHEIIE